MDKGLMTWGGVVIQVAYERNKVLAAECWWSRNHTSVVPRWQGAQEAFCRLDSELTNLEG